MEKKYEATNDPEITRMNLYHALDKSSTCQLDNWEDFDESAAGQHYGWRDRIPYVEGKPFYLFVHKHLDSGVLNWLVDKDFLREVAEEVFYQSGDEFHIINPDDNSLESWTLTTITYKGELLGGLTNNGRNYNDFVRLDLTSMDQLIGDKRKDISHEEFERIAGSAWSAFKKV